MTTPPAIDPAATADEVRLIAPELVEVGPDGPRLIAGRCAACGALSFPKALICTECLGEAIAASHLSIEGTLYSFAVVHQAPKGWTVPYVLGYVDLPEGIRVLAHIEGSERDIAIDAKVRLSVGRVGSDASGAPLASYVFVPSAAR